MILLLVLAFALSALVAWQFRSTVSKYKQFAFKSGLTGKEVAQRMLEDHNIYNVKIISTPGSLTDHYNPLNRTINLSEDSYNSNSIVAVAVAAHETGHAIQHARSYYWLTIRSVLVPVVSFSSNIVPWILIGGILTISAFPALIWIGIALFAMTTLFTFVTLPVEFDASKRALNWLLGSGLLMQNEHQAAYDTLKWAAMTYVANALSSLFTLLYYVMIALSARR